MDEECAGHCIFVVIAQDRTIVERPVKTYINLDNAPGVPNEYPTVLYSEGNLES